jgi:AraC-like DNA-binding protein
VQPQQNLFAVTFEYNYSASGALLALEDFSRPVRADPWVNKPYFRILWSQSEHLRLTVDGIPTSLAPHQILFLTPHNRLALLDQPDDAIAFVFNRDFYCIKDHDREVSCIGLLFYGASTPTVIDLNDDDRRSFELLLQVFVEEFKTRDHIQGEMLEMLLKRLIIKSTRLARQSLPDPGIRDTQLDIIRRFNVLVDEHFREKHKVSDYAEMLFKSPKTLSNLFKKYSEQTPLQVIHDRIALEAKRLLLYTGRTAEEITFELGFTDAAHFSRFFKRMAGVNPSDFRKTGSGR